MNIKWFSIFISKDNIVKIDLFWKGWAPLTHRLACTHLTLLGRGLLNPDQGCEQGACEPRQAIVTNLEVIDFPDGAHHLFPVRSFRIAYSRFYFPKCQLPITLNALCGKHLPWKANRLNLHENTLNLGYNKFKDSYLHPCWKHFCTLKDPKLHSIRGAKMGTHKYGCKIAPKWRKIAPEMEQNCTPNGRKKCTPNDTVQNCTRNGVKIAPSPNMQQLADCTFKNAKYFSGVQTCTL